MDKIREIADKADMIVNGYAFTRENDHIRILNLNNLDKALVISEDGNGCAHCLAVRTVDGTAKMQICNCFLHSKRHGKSDSFFCRYLIAVFDIKACKLHFSGGPAVICICFISIV